MNRLIIISILFLGSCSQIDRAGSILDDASYEAAQKAKDYLCNRARVGAIRKLFVHNQDRLAYMTFCTNSPPLIPPQVKTEDADGVNL